MSGKLPLANHQNTNTNMSKLIAEGSVLITKARIGHPKLFTAEQVRGDASAKKRFGCVIHVSKDDKETCEILQNEIDRLTKIHFKGAKLKSKDLFIKDGDGEEGDEFSKNCWIISANRPESQGRPNVRDRDGKTPIDSMDGRPAPGNKCNFIIGIYKPKDWPKICASLETVQYVEDDGVRYGGSKIDVDSILPDLSEDEDFEP